MLNAMEVKLVKALRSGRYKQTREVLKDQNGYCCLGVACTVSRKGRWASNIGMEGIQYEYLHAYTTLPNKVMLALDWETVNGRVDIPNRNGDNYMCLSELNDHGFTFSQIADIIEAGLVQKRGTNLTSVLENE